ncbi:hypothetical protein ACFV0O_28840 [Kitasatospora sp. NPDC059577]
MDAVDQLREIRANLPPADGAAALNRLYLTVTEAARGRLGGHLPDP